MNFDHQQDDTGGLLAGFLSLIGLIALVAIIAWIGTHCG